MDGPVIYCSGLHCGRNKICAKWIRHLTPPYPTLNVAQYADPSGRCDQFELRRIVTYTNVPVVDNSAGPVFPEDDLPLLAPSIHSMSPSEFVKHVSSLQPAIKVKKVKEQKPILKGKKVKAPTKKADGIYLVSLTVIETEFEFSYGKSLEINAETFSKMLSTLQCPELQLKEFLAKKKFILI